MNELIKNGIEMGYENMLCGLRALMSLLGL